MKSHLIIPLACCALVISSCQKESLQSSRAANTTSDSRLSNDRTSVIDPNNFVSGIDNTYFPLVPGTTFYYKNTINEDGQITTEKDEVYVTYDIKVILGVNCEVVHDVVSRNGQPTEDTYDWYAQDKDGTVWYFGEDSKELQNGQWVNEGSWEGGVNGAEPGIVMYGRPQDHIHETYYQEYLKGTAEDQAKIQSTRTIATIQMGTFKNCVVTKETTRLEPDVREYKTYAPGVGNISTVMSSGGDEHEELVKVKHP